MNNGPVQEISIIRPIQPPNQGCIICLPGRGNSSQSLINFCEELKFYKSTLVCLRPYRYQWYPMPNGPDDQNASLKGLKKSLLSLNKEINRILDFLGIAKQNTALVGFSAGAVMALQLAIHHGPWGAAVSHSGAILDTETIPTNNGNTTQILLQHNGMDMCFSWYERYVPMKYSLIKNKYNIKTCERIDGGHYLTYSNIIQDILFLEPIFGYASKKRIRQKKSLRANLFL